MDVFEGSAWLRTKERSQAINSGFYTWTIIRTTSLARPHHMCVQHGIYSYRRSMLLLIKNMLGSDVGGRAGGQLYESKSRESGIAIEIFALYNERDFCSFYASAKTDLYAEALCFLPVRPFVRPLHKLVKTTFSKRLNRFWPWVTLSDFTTVELLICWCLSTSVATADVHAVIGGRENRSAI